MIKQELLYIYSLLEDTQYYMTEDPEWLDDSVNLFYQDESGNEVILTIAFDGDTISTDCKNNSYLNEELPVEEFMENIDVFKARLLEAMDGIDRLGES